VFVIAAFFVGHWVLSVFFQSFFLHRYGAHRMFTMSKGWERVFHLAAFVFQGSSYLEPRAYAILHREHHAYSDTPGDPHSPHVYKSLSSMMGATKARFEGLMHRKITPEARFEGGYPSWPLIDRLGDMWITRIAFIVLYALFYLHFAPHWAFYFLVPVHALMGPIHGAIVNWCGHKYGYRNFDTSRTDRSRNTLPVDLITFGELFQNNHHTYPMAPNFAARRFEFDPTWLVIKLLGALRIIKLPAHVQKMSYPARQTGAVGKVVAA
jgi:stearoyl-CoA desaturase (delta-9 desaturase)